MRTWTRRRAARPLTTLVTAAALVAAGAGTASADLVVNGVDDSIDTTVEQLPLSLATGPGTTTVYVVAADGDNDPGCNFDGTGETVTVSLAVDRPDVATVSPTSLVLGACGPAGAQTVTVTPHAVGTATVTTTVAAGSNKTGGSFSIANARFAAKVSAVPNTPPTLAVVGVEQGGEYPKGTLARPSCTVTDVDDFPVPPHTSTWPAPLTEVAGPWAVDGIGTRYAMCSYTDGAGVQVLARTGYAVVDDSAPLVQRTLEPGPDGTGWYRGDVLVAHTVTENQSPSSLQPPVGCDPVRVTTDTPLTTLTCSATSAGGTRTLTTNIRRDATPPVVSPTTTVTGGGPVVDGWSTTPVQVTFTASDETSLFLVDDRASRTASRTVTTEGDGELVVASPVFTDRAGNSSPAGAVVRAVKVDTSAPRPPTASLSTLPAAEGWHTAPVTVTFAPAGDAGSGVASCTAPVTVDADTAGRTVAGTCTDRAGHVSAATEVTVRLDRGAPVVTGSTVAQAPTGTDGWYTGDVGVDFAATDELSGLVSPTQRATSSGEGPEVEVRSPAVTDRAGNTTPAGALTRTVKVDRTPPAVPTFVGAHAPTYLFGEVPPAPSCTSSDAVSGLASCVVTGGGTAVGPQRWTATATDRAGHVSTAVLAYEVLPWRTAGFQQPVDTGGVVNSVKGGSTVPVKFELFAGARELTALENATFTLAKVTCGAGAVVDEIELLASGSTALRYDAVAGHYQYNWKTPTGAACYSLTMTARDGATTAVALFRTR